MLFSVHHKRLVLVLRYLFLVLMGLLLTFPLIYLFFSSFKTNNEIFGSLKLLPERFILDGYINGWNSVGQFTFGRYLFNTFVLVIPVMAFTIVSSLMVAYGFNRFEFPLKKTLFIVLLALMMLPAAVLIVPRYLLFSSLGWVNTYFPFWIPALFATSSFFVYMFIQFFRSIPRELDESAHMDGCGSFRILVSILLPLCVPVVLSAAVFLFIWTWNAFLSQYIYINSVRKYTVSLALRISIDAASRIEWNNILAMSFVAMIPSFIVFFTLQRFFLEGISTSGLKG